VRGEGIGWGLNPHNLQVWNARIHHQSHIVGCDLRIYLLYLNRIKPVVQHLIKFFFIIWSSEQVVALLLIFLAPVKVGITCCYGKEWLSNSLSSTSTTQALCCGGPKYAWGRMTSMLHWNALTTWPENNNEEYLALHDEELLVWSWAGHLLLSLDPTPYRFIPNLLMLFMDLLECQ